MVSIAYVGSAAPILLLCSTIPFASTVIKCNCPKPKEGFLNVHVICHTHDDISWLKTFDQYYLGTNSGIQNVAVQHILETVVDELMKNEERRFVYVESAFFWRWWKEQSNEIRNHVIRLVDGGQLEFAGGGWSMNDEANPSYQQIIDSFTWGFRKLNELFGEHGRPKVGWQIDPFGASREQASLFAQFGFDGTFVNRVDFNEKTIRHKNKTAEFIWRGSPNLGEMSDIFTNVMYNHYSAITGFNFESMRQNEAIVDNKNSSEYNVDKKAERIITEAKFRKNFFQSNNVYLTFGDDFTYNNAISWFKNIDKLIKYINSDDSSKTHIFYSTPSCYIKSVNDANLNLTTKSDDFFPYRSDERSTWTGYFTTRPSLKYFIRFANNLLQSIKQLCAMTDYSEEEEGPLDLFRAEVGMANHHDTITGTSMQHVVKANVKRLAVTIDHSKPVMDGIIKNLLKKTREPKLDIEFEPCLHLNVSECSACESRFPFVLTLYNPLSHPISHYVRVPVYNDLLYSVLNPEGEKIPAQLVPLPKEVVEIPGRSSNSTMELVFKAEVIPALGFKSYYVAPSNDVMETTREMDAKNLIIGNQEKIAVEIDSENGLVKNIFKNGVKYPMSQEFFYYSSSRRPQRGSPSGAYIFNPEYPESRRINSKAQVHGYSGSLVHEIHQTVKDWMTQVIRIYKDEEHIEFEWLVGPMDVRKNHEGKEITSVYKLHNLNSDRTFLTDSNGREMMTRVKNRRTRDSEVMPGYYYPVTSRVVVRDQRVQMAVLPDRPQGGTSLHDGEIELMIQRNLLFDDNKGIGESLVETEFGKEIVVRGKHWLTLGNVTTQSAVDRILAKERFHPVVTYATPANNIKFSNWNEMYKMEYSGLKYPLPENVHILTLEPWKWGTLLLRLEHIMESHDHIDLSKPVTVDLKDLFNTFKIKSMKEMTLGGNMELKNMHRLHWKTVNSAKQENRPKITHDDSELQTMEIILHPMEIRTFILIVHYY
ncbi:lysosomal alpha-mannosidase isoform X2 [Nilaparvata lugens]|uniref:lysosomal alpha-mannosidase isoform X2 n=1 Tax=Nilaparvata lugens TaxID=108931 RepID=UPI00193D677A|nr:lysosomal alpha-mannosidase isoform X2 [Nilaparvata lugens]